MRFWITTVMLALGLPLTAANAGGVVIDFREAEWGSSDGSPSGESPKIPAQGSPLPEKRLDPDSPQVETPAPPMGKKGSGADRKASVAPRSPVAASPSGLGEIEVQLIRDGLLTPEEAAAGCGGSTAARGPLGLLPLGLAAFALLRLRRNR